MNSNIALPKYKYVRLEEIDNGYMLTYEERLPKPVKDTYGETRYVDRKLSFTDEKADTAFDEFKRLHTENREERAKNIASMTK